MKKPKSIICIIIGMVLLLGLVVTFPKFYKMYITDPIKEQEKEKPKLKIINLDSKTRPIAVMINNIAVARNYHSGLQDAYLVYEIIVEGGLTRLMALYKDAKTERIGSVRSSRHYYLDYALENDAIYVHWGYSPYAINDIQKLKINNIDGYNYGNKYFWRDNSINVALEHRAYTNMELINEAINKLGYKKETNEKPLLNYSIEDIDVSTIEDAIPANNIKIKYSGSVTTNYTYDIENKVYLRSVNDVPHIDYVTKEQYTAKNIITYQVKNTSIPNDEKNRQNIDNVGTGNGYYISNGYAIPITWTKKSRSEKTIYRLKNGEELQVNDGNTYIQIQPINGLLSIS